MPNIRLPFVKGESQSIEDRRCSNIEFSLPRLGSKPKLLDLNSKKLQAFLHNYSAEKTQQIREALKYIEQLNKSDVKTLQRFDLTNIIMTTTGQAMTDLYRNNISKGASFPESTERKTDLTSIIALLQSLIVSYKLILVSDYALPIKKFNQIQERLAFSLLRILELSLWLQRLLAIRFQKLSIQNWKELNLVFFIYANHFDINEDKPLVEQLSLYKASGILCDKNSRRSAASVYQSIQIFGLLDISSWPSNAMQSVEQYLEQHEDLCGLSIKELSSLPDHTVVTYSAYPGVPMFNMPETKQSACYIDISRMKKQVERDIDILEQKNFIGEDEKSRLKPHGKVDELESNAGLLQLLIKNLSQSDRQEERKSLYGSKIVHIYNGLAASYRYLYEQSETRGRSEEDENYFHNAAAKHSSLLVDSESDVLEFQWRIINESTGGYLIRTVETKYMHTMEVGQLIAITADDAVVPAQLGFITRLDRLRENEIDVAVVKVSNYAQAVTILEPGQENKGRDLMPGILIKNTEEKWHIILPRHVKYVSGTPVVIKRENNHIPVRLGDTVLTKNGFIMFEARSPGLK